MSKETNYESILCLMRSVGSHKGGTTVRSASSTPSQFQLITSLAPLMPTPSVCCAASLHRPFILLQTATRNRSNQLHEQPPQLLRPCHCRSLLYCWVDTQCLSASSLLPLLRRHKTIVNNQQANPNK